MAQASTSGFAVVYEFELHPGREADFVRLWTTVTEDITRTFGSFGSRLHHAGGQRYLAYASWPSRESWMAMDGTRLPHPENSTAMRDCCSRVDVLELLDVVSDRLILPLA